jgi:hypothetical protein
MSKLDAWSTYTKDCEEMITSLVNVLDAEYAIKKTVKPYVKKEVKARRNLWEGPPPSEQFGNPLRFYSNLCIQATSTRTEDNLLK